MDGEDDGFATGLSTCLTKDGQTTPTANIPLGGFKLTGVGAATSRTDAARGSNLQDNDLTYFTATGTDTYALTPAPALTAYAAGQGFYVKFTNANTGAATLNVSGLGAKSIVKGGSVAMAVGDIAAGQTLFLIYDGTNFQVVSSQPGFANGGTKSSAYSAAANTKYLVDATAAAFTTNLGGITTVQASVRITKFGTTYSHFLQGTINGSADGLTIAAGDEGVIEIEYTGASRGFV